MRIIDKKTVIVRDAKVFYFLIYKNTVGYLCSFIGLVSRYLVNSNV